MVEIDDKTFRQMILELDCYIWDDSMIECVERVIVALNRYRDIEKIPILHGGEVYSQETRKLEPHPDSDKSVVKSQLKKLNKSYENDEWIN